MTTMISVSEVDFITKSIQEGDGIRIDGRVLLGERPHTVHTGVVVQASGSCRVQVEQGTDVLVGVKASVGDMDEVLNKAADATEEGETNAASSDENDTSRGRIVCSIDCSPAAAMAIGDNNYKDQLLAHYTHYLNQTLNGPMRGLDLRKLVIIPNASCWILHVDILILNYGGNLLDTIFAAVHGALYDTLLPKVAVQETDGHFEFEVADEETDVLPGRQLMPLCTTLYAIGNRYVLDPLPHEEKSCDFWLTLLISPSGKVGGIQKGGPGSISPSLLIDMIQTAKNRGKERVQQFQMELKQQDS